MFTKTNRKVKFILAVAFSILVILNAVVSSSVKNSANIKANNDLAAIEYDQLSPDDIYAENTQTGEECRNVIFKAFFPKDINGDGLVEEMLGSCEDGAMLYIDVGVQNGGRLESGYISIGSRNFMLETAELKDDVLAQNYVGKDIKSFQLKTMQSGTQKLIIGNIHQNLTTIESFSQSNPITFTGRYYPEEGDPIYVTKTINLTVDILGSSATTSATQNGGSYNRKELATYTGDIPLSFDLNVVEKGLINKKNIVEMEIGKFQGLYPNSIIVSNVPDEEYEYDEENHILRINHTTQQRSVIYKITMNYPHSLYDLVDNSSAYEHTYSAIFPTKVHSVCYNNPHSEGGEEYITKEKIIIPSITIRSVTPIVIPTPTHYFDVYVEGGQLLKDGKTKGVSKTVFLKEYDEFASESADKMGYTIHWNMTRAKNGEPTTYRMEDRDSRGDNFNSNFYLEDYLQTSKVVIDVRNSIMPRGGKIYIYESETNELVKEITTTGSSKTYSYTFDTPIKDIRIETSEDSGLTGQINVTCYRYFDIEKMKNEISRDTIEGIYRFTTAAICGGSRIGNTFSMQDSLNYEVAENYAKLEVTPEVLSITEINPVNQTYKISLPSSGLEHPTWTNGYFELIIPKAGISYLELVSGANVTDATTELVEEDDNYVIKIKTTTDISGRTFRVICKVMPNQLSNATMFNAKLLYSNENCEDFYSYTERDTRDVDHDGNTNDYVGRDSVSVKLSAPSTFYSYTTISDYNDKGSVTLAPTVALINSETRSAKININFYNGYNDRTCKNFVIVGRVPCEGNTYVDGSDMGSHFTTKMTSDGLNIPEILKGKVTVYYSENASASKDLENTENGWIAAENVTTFDNIKSYMIVTSGNAIQLNRMYQISYDIEIPHGIPSNVASYAGHKIYFDVISEEGTYATSVSPARLGFRVIRYYDMELQKYKEGTTLPVRGAAFRVDGSNEDGMVYARATSDQDGKILLRNIIANQIYTLRETYTPSNYELNTGTSEFIVREDQNGDLSVEVLSGDLLNQDSLRLTKDADNKDVLKSDAPIYNTPRYKLVVNKVDSKTKQKMSNIRFDVSGKGSFYTNENGQFSVESLSFGKQYTLSEPTIEYYYKKDNIDFEIQKDGENYTIVSESEEMQNAIITNPDDSDLVIVEITIANEDIPLYNLKIVKENVDDETVKLANASFVLSRDDMGDAKVYTTGEDGSFTVNGLYEYVEGKNATGKYTLKEQHAPAGYVKNSEEIEFVVRKNDAGKYIVNITNRENLTSVKDARFEGDTLVITITNTPVFKLVKLDYETQQPLAGVDFVIYELNENNEIVDFAKDANGDYLGVPNEKGDWIVTTNSQGIILLELPAGTYKAVEYNYPEGYVDNGNSEIFTVGNKIGKANWGDSVIIKPTISLSSITPGACDPSSVVTEISKIEDLIDFKLAVDGGDNYLGKAAVLRNDLDFNNEDDYRDASDTSYGDLNGNGEVESIKDELTNLDGKGFEPIAESAPFQGTFNGDGHEIKNIYINSTGISFVGLFGMCNNAQITNLGITGSIKGNQNAFVAPILAYNQSGQSKVYNCYSKVNIECTDVLYAFGIAGSSVAVENCYNEGNISVNAVEQANTQICGIGGGSAVNCYNRGNLTATAKGDAKVMGITSVRTITNCYNTGNVSATTTKESSEDAVAIAEPISINSELTDSNSYYLDTITIVGDRVSEATSKTSEEMKQQAFANTLGSTIWEINANKNDGYPILKDNYIKEINKIEDLVTISNYVKNGKGGSYAGVEIKLNNDLDFTDDDSYEDPNRTDFGDINGNGTVEALKTELTTGTGFYPIGDRKGYTYGNYDAFFGSFDGQNHTISNLYENGSDAQGLFGVANVITVKNLTVTGTITTTSGYCGGICGLAYNGYAKFENCTSNVTIPSCKYATGGILGASSTNMKGVYIKSCKNLGNITSTDHGIGGILGQIESNGAGAYIEACENHGYLSGQVTGGIFGYAMNVSNGVIIKSCNNTGGINGNYAGGILAEAFGGNGIIVESSENHGTVTSNGEYAGGIVGYLSGVNIIDIEDCSNTANVISTNFTGGYIGYSSGVTIVKNGKNNGQVKGSMAGGVVGYANSTSVIEKIENTGNVEGSIYTGGLIGYTGQTFFIDECINRGKITLASSNYCGGAVGYGSGDNAKFIENTYNYGEIVSSGYTGGLVGWTSNITIQHCGNEGKITSSYYTVGGIIGVIGSSDSNLLLDCYNKGEIISTANSLGNGIGGIVGYSNYGNGTIVNCYNTANITANKVEGVAGIMGYGKPQIINCYNTGDISSSYRYTGGIAGYSCRNIIKCYNEGNITVTDTEYANVGGIVGYSSYMYSSSPSEIKDCYNKGDITATGLRSGSYVSGVCGGGTATCTNCLNYGNVFVESLYDTWTSGIIYSGTVSYCSNSGDIYVVNSANSGSTYVGGVTYSGTANNCYNSGNIKANIIEAGTYSSYVGGILGTFNGNCTNCINEGKVELLGKWKYGYAGGITAYSGNVELSCNKGDVIANSENAEYVYLGGISGSANVTNSYNYGNVSSNIDALGSNTYIGGISGNGTVNYAYNTGDVYSYYGVQSTSTVPTTRTNAISASTANQNAYVTDKAITVGPDKTDPNGVVLDDNYMKTEEFYEKLLPGSEQWTYNEGKYPTLDIPVIGFNETAEVIMTNIKQEFDIITDIGVNQDGERAGGTLSGTYNDKYVETPTTKTKFVESVEYGENSTEPIVITPDTGWAIRKVTINNEDFGFEAYSNEQGVCTIPAGYFQDVRKNYTVTATFGRIEKMLTITKTDPEGNPLEGAVFDIYEYDERTEPQDPVGELVQDATEKEYDAIIPLANQVNYSTTYKFLKDAYGYHSNNYHKKSTTAGMYIPIDLTNETESYELAVNYTISSEANYDFGVAAVTTSTSQITTSTSPNLFKVSGATTTDTATQTLAPGQLYYLHVIYSKDSSTDKNNDQLDINYITVTRKVNRTFGFDVVDGKYVSTNNTKLGSTTYSTAHIPIDLTDCEGPCDVIVNYDKICSSSNSSYGYLVLNSSPDELTNKSGYFKQAYTTESNITAKKKVTGGSMYYLHLIQENNGSTNTQSVDKFIINSVTARLNKDDFYQIENLVTNSRGQIKTELNYGTYEIVEKQAPEGYTLNTTPTMHIVGDGTDNNVTIVNQPKAKVIAHYYVDGTEDDPEPVKLAADITQYGDVGTSYKTNPILRIEDYELKRDENDDPVIPDNATGNFGVQDIHVKYLYDRNEPEQVQYTVHYTYDGVEDMDAKDTFTVSEGTIIKRDDVVAKDKDGYYLYDIENTPLEVLSTNESNDIYVRYVRMAYSYEVHYFYDGVENGDEAYYDGVDLFGELISDYEDKCFQGYKLEKARALDENGEEKALPLVIKAESEKNVINVYYVSVYNITTNIVEKTETKHNGVTIPEVKGGTISGEYQAPYEEVQKGFSSTKPIVVEANDGYVIDNIKVNNEPIDYSSYVQRSAAHKVVLPEEYFTNVQEDKHVLAEFKKVSDVKVKYMIDGTETPLYTDSETGNDYIEYDGYEGDSFSTTYKTFTGYKLNSIKDQDGTVLTGENNVISGNMYADELIVTYWYDVDNSTITEEHILINEDSSIETLDTDSYTGQVGTSKTLNRKTYDNYEAAEGPTSTETIIVVGKTENSKEVEYASNVTKTVRFYYERKDGTVTVHYMDKATNTEIENPQTPEGVSIVNPKVMNGKAGRTYTTDAAQILGYTLDETTLPDNATGTYQEGNIDVYYYYTEDDYAYNIYYWLGTTKQEDATVSNRAKYGQTINYEQKTFTNYVFDHADKENIVISRTESENVLNVYYKLDESKITEKHIDITTGEEVVLEEHEYTQDVTTSKTFNRLTNENYVAADAPANVPEGIIVVGKTENSKEVTFEQNKDKEIRFYYVKAQSKVTEKHIDITSGSEVVLETHEYTQNVGTTKTFNRLTDVNYVAADGPESTELILVAAKTENSKEVTFEANKNKEVRFYYVKAQSKITEKHIDITTGEEVVLDTHEYVENVGTSKTFNRLTNENYVAAEGPEGTELIIVVAKTENSKSVTFEANKDKEIRFYYVKAQAKITEKHIDITSGSEVIIDTHEYTDNVGETKTFNRLTDINYVATDAPADVPEGIIVAGKTENSRDVTYEANKDKEIRFYYVKAQATLTEKHIDLTTGEEIEISSNTYTQNVGTSKTLNRLTDVNCVAADGPESQDENVIVAAKTENSKEVTFEANKNKEVRFYYVKAQAKITEKHIDITNGSEVIIEEHEYTENVGTSKTLTRLTSNFYVGADAPANVPEGIIVVGKTETSKEVTFEVNNDKEVRFYYVKAETIIRERHIDITTGSEVEISSENHTGIVGESITLNRLADDIYEAADGPEVTEENVIVAGKSDTSITENYEPDVIKEVRFYYTKKQGKVIVEYVDNLTGEEVHGSTELTGTIGTGYTVTRIDVPGHKLDLDNLPNETGSFTNEIQTVTYKYIKLRPYELIVRYTVEHGDNDQAKFMVKFKDTQINDYTTNGELKIGNIELTDLEKVTYTVYETDTPEFCDTVLREDHPAVVELEGTLNTVANKYEFIANYEEISGFNVIIDEENQKVIFDVRTKKDVKYDLSIQKFVSAINGTQVTGREPIVEVKDGKITYTKNNEIVKTENKQNVTYTLRVYNESDNAGFGKRIIEYIPEGLVYVPENETNRNYGWKMYKIGADNKYVETTDVNEAVIVATDYIAGRRIEKANIAEGIVNYLDLDVVFKVDENKLTNEDRIIENKVSIIKDDRDDNTENDVTTEKLYVKYFDLEIEKYIEKIKVEENDDVREETIGYARRGELVKVDIKRSNINRSKITVTYGLRVTNVGEIAGRATELEDFMPEGFKLVEDGIWTVDGNRTITNTLSDVVIEPGESKDVYVTFEWNVSEDTIGLKSNEAHISKYENDFGAKDLTEDNRGKQDMLVSIKTGSEVISYVAIALSFVIIISAGTAVIKRKTSK